MTEHGMEMTVVGAGSRTLVSEGPDQFGFFWKK